MELRAYRAGDCAEMAQLFYETVHAVNAGDYTAEQLDAWATGTVDLAAWERSFLAHDTQVAVEAETGQILGFGDMDAAGYLDRLYVHRAWIGCEIGRALVEALEARAGLRGVTVFTTHASITARPFFLRMGYEVVEPNVVVRGGVELQNFVMVKGRGCF